MLGTRLYREVQTCRKLSISVELSDLDTPTSCLDALSPRTTDQTSEIQSTSSKRSASGDTSLSKRKNTASDSFVLPKFSPDIARAASKDEFFSAALQNKLIRESCRALKGHCQLQERSPTTTEKRNLGKMLYNLSPKSLGDPEGLAVVGVPEVYACMFCDTARSPSKWSMIAIDVYITFAVYIQGFFRGGQGGTSPPLKVTVALPPPEMDHAPLCVSRWVHG